MSTDISQKIEFIARMLECSQITITDIADITTISRTSYYRWKDGKPASDRIRINAAYITAQRIEQAIKDNRLPLQARIPNKKERLAALRRIIRESTPQAS